VTAALRAELVPDGGAAAAEESEFFRAPTFLRAEGVTHSLVIGDGRAVLPVVRREVPGGRYDGISPYGYPGGTRPPTGPPVPIDEIDFRGTGLVSLFLRERLGAPALAGGTPLGRLLLHDPELPREIHRRVATKVRSNERKGYRTSWTPGPDVDDALLDAFSLAYAQTMQRAEAAERYFFPADYLRACLDAPSSWMVAVHGPEQDVAAAAIACASDGYLHYYLGGTLGAHRSAGPSKNLMVGMLDLADKLALPLNLGGGMQAGDSLEQFKESFTNSEARFVCHRVVCDPEEYAELAAGRDDRGFFPAYRAP
jgi:hypothetical protein